jgi:uncharacterized repeat protein (TIGR03943 family)
MRIRLWIRATLLILLGLYFLDTVITGRVTIYINQSFTWLAWFAGFVFLLLGATAVYDLLRRPLAEGSATLDVRLQWLTSSAAPSWLLLGVMAVPLALGLLVPARPLGAAAVSNASLTTSLSGSSVASGAVFSVPPEQRSIMDWVRSFGASGSLTEFSGQPVDVVGFVYNDVQLDKNTQFFAMRFVVSCCVADASSIGLIVEYSQTAELAADTWVRVKGKLEVKAARGQPAMPVVVAESVEQVEQPDHPYLYP